MTLDDTQDNTTVFKLFLFPLIFNTFPNYKLMI